VKNRWNSTLKRQTQADSDNDSSCPAAKRSKHPCDWRLQPRMARAQSDPSALFLAGMVRAGPSCPAGRSAERCARPRAPPARPRGAGAPLGRRGGGADARARAQDPALYACLPPADGRRQSLDSASASAASLAPAGCLGALGGELGAAGLPGCYGVPPWAGILPGHFSSAFSAASRADSDSAASVALSEVPPLQDWSLAGGARGAFLPASLQHEMAAATHNWAAAVATRGEPGRGRAGAPCMPSRGSAPGDLGWCQAPLPPMAPRGSALTAHEAAWAGGAGPGFPYGMDREAALAALLAAGLPAAAAPPCAGVSPFSALVLEPGALLGAGASPFDVPGLDGARGGLLPGAWPPPRPPPGARPGPTVGSAGSNESEETAVPPRPDFQTALATLQARARPAREPASRRAPTCVPRDGPRRSTLRPRPSPGSARARLAGPDTPAAAPQARTGAACSYNSMFDFDTMDAAAAAQHHLASPAGPCSAPATPPPAQPQDEPVYDFTIRAD